MNDHKYNMENLLNYEDYIMESNSLFLMDNETKNTLLKLDEKYHKYFNKLWDKVEPKFVKYCKHL